MTRLLYNATSHTPHTSAHATTTNSSGCMTAHRCRIYSLPRLLTDPRWLGSTFLTLELLSSDRQQTAEFVRMLKSALEPQIAAKVEATSAHSCTVSELAVKSQQIDPTQMLMMIGLVLYVEVEKRSGDAAASSSSSSRTIGHPIVCHPLRADATTHSRQMIAEKLRAQIATERENQNRLLSILRMKQGQPEPTNEAEADNFLSEFLSAATPATPASSRSSSKPSSSVTLTTRIRTEVEQHESTRRSLLEILQVEESDSSTIIHAVYSCQCCEQILCIEGNAESAVRMASSASSAAAASSSSAIASSAGRPPAAASPAATSGRAAVRTHPSSAAANLLTPEQVRARFAEIQSQLRSASGLEGKARRKKLNLKMRELKEKYQGVVDFDALEAESAQQSS